MCSRFRFPSLIATKTFNPKIYNLLRAGFCQTAAIKIYPDIYDLGRPDGEMRALARELAKMICPGHVYLEDKSIILGAQGAVAPDYFPYMQTTDDPVVWEFFSRNVTRADQVLCVLKIPEDAKRVLIERNRWNITSPQTTAAEIHLGEVMTMMIEEKRVNMFPLRDALTLSYEEGSGPIKINIWVGGYLALEEGASHYLVVYEGKAFIGYRGDVRALTKNYYGVFPGKMELTGEGTALVVSCFGYSAISLLGGPIEKTGRLRYIDNCTNTVLLQPPVKGEPCLNYLDLCAGTTQTAHTHPTIRIGVVLEGNGACGTADGTLPMRTGTVFVIPPDTLHSFQSHDEPLKIVIYHPDSVDGPTHTNNTMLNNTFVAGKSAQEMPHIHTKGN